jgi:hypothetical protein
MSRLRITLEEDGVKGELIDGTGVVRSERIPFNDEELVETQAAALTVPTLFTFLRALIPLPQTPSRLTHSRTSTRLCPA